MENIVTDNIVPTSKIYIDTNLTFLLRVNVTSTFIDWEHIIYDLIIDPITNLPIGGMADNDLTLLKGYPILYKYNEELRLNKTEVGWENIGTLIKQDDNIKPIDASSNHNDIFIDILSTQVFQYTNVLEPSGASYGWEHISNGELLKDTLKVIDIMVNQ